MLAASVVPASASAAPAPSALLTDQIPVGFDAVDKFFYEGEEIPGHVTESEGLACVQTPSGHYCFDDVASADQAFSDDLGETGSQAAARFCAVNPLWEYNWFHFNSGGGAYSLYYSGAWIDYATINNNKTTSFQSGKASSIFARWIGGNGPKYSGPGTQYCGYQPDLRGLIWNGLRWNNRFSSRARIK